MRAATSFVSSLLIAIVLVLLFLATCLAEAPRGDPFDANNNDNPFDMSRLTCAEFKRMFSDKNPTTADMIIFLYGLLAGLDRKIVPFTKDEVVGIPLFALAVCKDRDDRIMFDALPILWKCAAVQRRINS